MTNEIVKTPLMRQYNAIKAKHPDAILLFRVGDFYETFSVDAIKTSEILGITLTKRANGSAQFVELAGFPYHALDVYLPKLVRAGERVAICEQLEDPKLTKNIVKRGVTELITPGVSLHDNILENRENNFLACIQLFKNNAGIALLDISTGEFYVAEGNTEYIDKLINSFKPKEILHEKSKLNEFKELFGTKFYFYPLDDWMFTDDSSYERLLKQFDTNSLKGFGIQYMRQAITAAGAILHYLDLTQHQDIKHITKVARIEEDKYVWLDKFTLRNLEIFNSIASEGKTFIDIIDKTISPMGARLLKRWIALPLKDITNINNRLEAVEFFINNQDIKDEIQNNIKAIGDLERLVSKISTNRINPREVIQIKNALFAIEPIKNTLTKPQYANIQLISAIAEQLNICNTIRTKIQTEIMDDPPNMIQKTNVIKYNVNSELDELRKISSEGKEYLENMQNKLIKITGITSLKINYNNVFGYFIEVKNTFKNRVPTTWTRKQTLVGAERYINDELKEYETKILGAEEKIATLELKIYEELIATLSEYINILQLNANLIANLDCILAFANLSIRNNYSKPTVNDSLIIDIKEGRHPVIEQQLPIGEEYITNNVYLDQTEQQIIMITGPNMAGKSALLRQTALIVLMAQIGCFVPAKKADIGYVDKIFTRVGASDNISLGESTFMVEMNEAASILNNMSNRSLILFDELGRGTSTYDGISIAWAIVEFIHEHPTAKPKTLFATHYHELNEMENTFNRIKNFNVSVRETENKIIFIRKLVPGGSEHSFGIHVARMAGMPKSVINRANEILAELEKDEDKDKDKKNINKPIKELGQKRSGYQLSFYQLDDPILKQIKDDIKKLDINNLTPLEALNKLNEIKKLIGLK